MAAALVDFKTWRKFSVLTLDQQGLKQTAHALAASVSGFQPNMLIGIRSGGYHVAQLMAESMQGCTLLGITCRRPGTSKKQKSSLLKRLLRKLPHQITDRLRVLEHIVLTQLRPAKVSTVIPDASELSEIERELMQRKEGARVLIVDDAIDSGATMAYVRTLVNAIANPSAAVKMAAITVTTASPVTEPDFSLYRYVLCRFPWSLDSRK
ncbi:MAG TPA: phosphoribosyltransferase family protein [Rickettsiales bacterium]|nr:phosphoribosyltransferase family protein [Rickettsiales bacterium]